VQKLKNAETNRENCEKDASDEYADAVEGELCRSVAAVGQAVLVLQAG